ncbi:MAG: hypothetical protein AAF805_12550, partial [Planctomycetota bacterium]
VINNIAVGGVQQVLLKVRIYEVSRTKLRKLGTDIGHFSDGGGYFGTSVSGLISNIGDAGANPIGIATTSQGVRAIADTAGQTVEFAITDGTDAFLGAIDALQQKNVAKILAEPNIVAVSGRPAQFNEGGEIPILVPQSLGQIAIEYKPFGTQVDFLPIVLGNGKIRLEVRPRVSDLDFANAVTINNTQVPALSVRQVDTAVEMNAGQTFAIAGLIQQRVRAVQRGIPLLSEIPILGVPFRSVEDENEEVELLILVTPEFVDAMAPEEVPPCGPGMGTTSPRDCDLYIDGKIEVTDRCSACPNGACGCPPCNSGGYPTSPPQLVNGTPGGQGGMMGGGMNYGGGANYGSGMVTPYQGQPMMGQPMPGQPMMAPQPAGESYSLPPTPMGYEAVPTPTGDGGSADAAPRGPKLLGAKANRRPGSGAVRNAPRSEQFRSTAPTTLVRTANRPYTPTPTGLVNPAAAPPTGAGAATDAGFIGPVGYEAE